MDFLKKVWPTTFKIKPKDITSFAVQLIIFIIVTAIAGAVIGLLSSLPVIGFIFAILGSLLGLYTTIGIVLCILNYFDVLK